MCLAQMLVQHLVTSEPICRAMNYLTLRRFALFRTGRSGQPPGGRFFANAFFNAPSQSPLILRAWGSGPGCFLLMPFSRVGADDSGR